VQFLCLNWYIKNTKILNINVKMSNWASHIFSSMQFYGCWIKWFLFCLAGCYGVWFFLPLCDLTLVFFFPVVCSTMICGNVMFLCSLLYCIIGHMSCYFACFCRPDIMEGAVSVASGHVDLHPRNSLLKKKIITLDQYASIYQ
jgi:hypothetical protein